MDIRTPAILTGFTVFSLNRSGIHPRITIPYPKIAINEIAITFSIIRIG